MAEQFFNVTYSIMLYGAVVIVGVLAAAIMIVNPKRKRASTAIAVILEGLLVFWVVDVILMLISAGIRLIV